ncbi:MAG: hypothetical protein COA43_13370 [Robiginitomaculum sp.]|nr:MAG: hypothetical protein COA43_13370 [Robiginitomaculum sp.]
MYALIFPILLLIIGFVFGRMNETKHLSSLNRREAELAHITTTNLKKLPQGFSESVLVTGNVVISIDYFKRLMATVRGIFGGPIQSYTILLERARREAILRMKEEAAKSGATMITNIRLQTSSVFQSSKDSVGSIEVHAYGTALK